MWTCSGRPAPRPLHAPAGPPCLAHDRRLRAVPSPAARWRCCPRRPARPATESRALTGRSLAMLPPLPRTAHDRRLRVVPSQAARRRCAKHHTHHAHRRATGSPLWRTRHAQASPFPFIHPGTGPATSTSSASDKQVSPGGSTGPRIRTRPDPQRPYKAPPRGGSPATRGGTPGTGRNRRGAASVPHGGSPCASNRIKPHLTRVLPPGQSIC